MTSLTFDVAPNSVTSLISKIAVWLYNYETQAYSTVDAVNSEALDLGGVFSCNSQYTSLGLGLLSSLIQRVSKSNSSFLRIHIPLYSYVISSDDTLNWTAVLTHETINLLDAIDNPAVKTLDYLSHDNGQLTLNFLYKGMVWDNAEDSGAEFTDILCSGTTSKMVANYYQVALGKGFGSEKLKQPLRLVMKIFMKSQKLTFDGNQALSTSRSETVTASAIIISSKLQKIQTSKHQNRRQRQFSVVRHRHVALPYFYVGE